MRNAVPIGPLAAGDAGTGVAFGSGSGLGRATVWLETVLGPDVGLSVTLAHGVPATTTTFWASTTLVAPLFG